MVETNRNRRVPAARACAIVCVALGATGCGLVPRSKLDECHRVSQTLRSENSRLKDVALDLRSQNQDLSQRAVDDSRKLAAQEEAVERLEKSVQAYQSEREQMASALETIKRQVRLTVSPHSAALPSLLEKFARTHTGWVFDAATLTLSAPPDLLFEPGKDRLRPEASEALKGLASELATPGKGGLDLEIMVPPDGPPIARAGFDPGADKAGGVTTASGRFLSAARAARVRERLNENAGLDPDRTRIVTPGPGDADGPDNAPRRFVIRFGLADHAREVARVWQISLARFSLIAQDR